MTDKDIERIAEAVVKLLMETQKVIDEEFKKEVEEMMGTNKDMSFGIITQNDLIEADLQKLEREFEIALDKENYVECDKLKKLITKLKDKHGM